MVGVLGFSVLLPAPFLPLKYLSSGRVINVGVPHSAQQLELVTRLVKGDNGFDKKQFNNKAAIYKTRNETRAYVIQALPGLPLEFIESRLSDIDLGGYDSDWQNDKAKLAKFIEAIKAEHEEKSSTKIILGDFNEVVLTIEDGTLVNLPSKPLLAAF